MQDVQEMDDNFYPNAWSGQQKFLAKQIIERRHTNCVHNKGYYKNIIRVFKVNNRKSGQIYEIAYV
jgi:hypothetical protein